MGIGVIERMRIRPINFSYSKRHYIGIDTMIGVSLIFDHLLNFSTTDVIVIYDQ
jgi:hypothetical protein